ncbi:alpha-N-acetylgalactosaminide alpha-2,6-sialyltransferase 2 isoform X1 [Gymnodraco acuticeps]|uniref:alpha-N-acetylgalactosaminide alpha-2,6-sialyltransferase n=2 Tax=Gymnodraco acuticeps TaxID=8218 RepID=A0A6P8VCB2_GYMAC|nr:alpha-N-acetylgalactosaminide alpha-2,6-sialyltransferase 2 isoform X1 [Gymnodraco acuticeps]
MAFQKKLLLGFVTAGSLLCVYLLCLNLETPLSSAKGPLKTFHRFTHKHISNLLDFGELLDQEGINDQSTPISTLDRELPVESKPEENSVVPNVPDVPNVPESSSRSDGVGKPRTINKAPLLPQQQPTKAHRPTEPSFIGDTYMSEVFPPQTECTDSIQRLAAKTEFGRRFLNDIPVVQWAQHVTQESYQRLRKYPGTHGWGGIDYKTLVDTLSVLNSSANWRMLDDWKDRGDKSECIRCAVVGNGGILKDSKKGKEIDSHHYVFRTNGAITKGFEQDVGSRTTHYTFSTNTMMNSMRAYSGAGYRGPPKSSETRYVFLPDHGRDYLLMKAAATHTKVETGPERNKNPSDYFGEDLSAKKLKIYHPDFVRYLRNRFLRSHTMQTKFRDIYRPSTGAVMLLAALHTCDQVSAYGFMTPDFKKYSDHYYDSVYHSVGFYANHDLRMELSLWQQLHQAGLIKLYMR